MADPTPDLADEGVQSEAQLRASVSQRLCTSKAAAMCAHVASASSLLPLSAENQSPVGFI